MALYMGPGVGEDDERENRNKKENHRVEVAAVSPTVHGLKTRVLDGPIRVLTFDF